MSSPQHESNGNGAGPTPKQDFQESIARAKEIAARLSSQPPPASQPSPLIKKRVREDENEDNEEYPSQSPPKRRYDASAAPIGAYGPPGGAPPTGVSHPAPRSSPYGPPPASAYGPPAAAYGPPAAAYGPPSSGRSGLGFDKDGGGVNRPGEVQLQMHVPTSAIGLIIGRNGTVIREMNSISGAHIQIHNREIKSLPPGSSAPTTTMVTISGSSQSKIEHAKRLVEDKLKDQAHRISDSPARGASSSSYAPSGYPGYPPSAYPSTAAPAPGYYPGYPYPPAADPNAAPSYYAYPPYSAAAPGAPAAAGGQPPSADPYAAYYAQYYSQYGYGYPTDGATAPGAPPAANSPPPGPYPSGPYPSGPYAG